MIVEAVPLVVLEGPGDGEQTVGQYMQGYENVYVVCSYIYVYVG